MNAYSVQTFDIQPSQYNTRTNLKTGKENHQGVFRKNVCAITINSCVTFIYRTTLKEKVPGCSTLL